MLVANTAWNLHNFRKPIIQALCKRGDEVIVAAGEDGTSKQLEHCGCKVVTLNVDSKGVSPARDLEFLFALRRVYGTYSPDVVLNFTIKPVIYGTVAARWLGIPVINTITGLGTAFIKDSWLTTVVEHLYKLSLPGASLMIFQNADDLALFRERKLVTTNPIALVPGPGIDLQEFRTVPVPKHKRIIFLLIARLLWDKGIAEYVEAARVVRKYHQGTQFQLLGPLGVANRTAISSSELSSWVTQGIVDYLGETGDVRPFIKAAHCIVLPSYREGLSRVLLEAAAMGRPLIAADVTGCRDVVEHEINGYLCKPRSAGDLAFKMRKFIELPAAERQNMGNQSRVIAQARFDVHCVVKTYLRYIDEEISKRS
jgi:glycosyltransferase involved in cell wall biosynthesis